MFVEFFLTFVAYIFAYVDGAGDMADYWLTQIPQVWQPVAQSTVAYIAGLPAETQLAVLTVARFLCGVFFAQL